MTHTRSPITSPKKIRSFDRGFSFVEMLLSRHMGEEDSLEQWIEKNTPFIKWDESLIPPDSLSIYFISKALTHRDPGDLFLDILKKWLLPHRNIYIQSFHNRRLTLQKDSQKICVCEIQIFVESNPDWIQIEANLPKIAKEITAAIQSETYARFLLESKAVDYDLKTTLAYQDLVKITKIKPIAFDSDVFHQLSHFISITDLKFREVRSSRHIARMICSKYLIRKQLSREINSFKEKRHLILRFLKTELKLTFGTKPTLGLIVGIHLFHKYEFFDEKHIINAVQKFIPKARGVKDSCYTYNVPRESILTIYIELEKIDGENFRLDEIKMLKKHLPNEMKMRIENLIPSIFMFRNEEEVMRNILILSQELKFVKDFPQVMITFDKQTGNHVHFTVIFVRILKKTSSNLFQSLRSSSHIQVLPEREQIVGYLRKKYPKEAHVFRLKLKKNPSILRSDSSVNLFEARQKIVTFLTESLGEIRDYNGGMILKQGELLNRFKEAFQEKDFAYSDLLEDFFYSLSPIEMQATLPLSCLATLFTLFLEGIQKDLEKKENYFFKTIRENEKTYLMIRAGDQLLLDEVKKILHAKKFHLDRSLTSSLVRFQGSHSLGYILDHIDLKISDSFIKSVEKGIANWLRKIENKQILRLNFVDIPESLDPRLRGDEVNSVIIKLLFDGLMRLDKEGKPTPAIAKSVTISPDQKVYTFKLRDCLWSDGSSVTANDFAYAWKKILSPEFSTPFAYFFYSIKNAKAVKEGNCPQNDLGIQILDEETLQITLSHPNPQFLELTAHSLYSPVNHRIDQIHPNWALHDGETYVCNGPFKLKRFNSSLELVKNPLHWDKGAVKLDQIHIYKANDYIAAQMFKNDEIDWIGRPTRPWQPYFSIGSKESVETYSVSGIFWYFFNLQKFPFNHPKMRQAFSYAINRKEICKALFPEGHAAYTPLPLNHTAIPDYVFPDGDIELARKLFDEALLDFDLKKEDISPINVMHADTYVKKIVAKIIKEQWKNAFHIPVCLECFEWNLQFTKMMEGDFQTSSVSWMSWINDPMYTLEAFKHRNNSVNFPKWENADYQKFLDLANQEIDLSKRKQYIAQAEKILLEEIPLTPIFYEKPHYMKKEGIKGACTSQTGIVDFKWASKEKRSTSNFLP